MFFIVFFFASSRCGIGVNAIRGDVENERVTRTMDTFYRTFYYTMYHCIVVRIYVSDDSLCCTDNFVCCVCSTTICLTVVGGGRAWACDTIRMKWHETTGRTYRRRYHWSVVDTILASSRLSNSNLCDIFSKYFGISKINMFMWRSTCNVHVVWMILYGGNNYRYPEIIRFLRVYIRMTFDVVTSKEEYYAVISWV